MLIKEITRRRIQGRAFVLVSILIIFHFTRQKAVVRRVTSRRDFEKDP